MPHSRLLTLALFALGLLAFASIGIPDDEDRAARQAELDSACASAREEQLAPMRQQLVDECVANDELGSREDCETYYADYGERAGDRAPLFYDLPPCQEAFDYAQSERSGA